MIETKCCRDVHEGCRIHFTDGVLRSECSNTFQLKYVTRQKENNIFKYRDNIKLHKRSINKLKESISRILIEESAVDRIYSDNGTICANKAWRIGRSNNTKVFYKDIQNEKGKYVCAMCAAPIVLEKANLLVDKKFTAYQGYDQKIKQGTYLNDKVVMDSNIVTSRGPATAYGFAYKLVELLGGDDLAVKKRMVYFNAFDVKEDE